MRPSLRTIVPVLLLAAAAIVPAGAGAAGGAADVEHCWIEVTGQLRSGELVTTEPDCETGGPLTDSTRIAAHFEYAGYTGAYLDVYASGCTGGWMNLPANWNDRISSTFSGCTVKHYEHQNLGGSVFTTYQWGGNITGYMDNRTSSTRYNP